MGVPEPQFKSRDGLRETFAKHELRVAITELTDPHRMQLLRGFQIKFHRFLELVGVESRLNS